jgi:hypothetical protein
MNCPVEMGRAPRSRPKAIAWCVQAKAKPPRQIRPPHFRFSSNDLILSRRTCSICDWCYPTFARGHTGTRPAFSDRHGAGRRCCPPKSSSPRNARVRTTSPARHLGRQTQVWAVGPSRQAKVNASHLSTLFPFSACSLRCRILGGKEEDDMTEGRKTTAQYLNGLAVAVLATTGGAFIGKSVSVEILVLAWLLSFATHALARWMVRE